MIIAKDDSHLRLLAANWDVTVVGSGLAGTECALQLALVYGFNVGLIEMRPLSTTPAHQTHLPGELVCSNSFGSELDGSASAQLKKEAMRLGSFIYQSAKQHQVPAGHALAVDRKKFSEHLEFLLRNCSKITRVLFEVKSLELLPRPCVIATGPLTSDALAQSLKNHLGSEHLYFFDAIAPIVSTDSIDLKQVFRQSRYNKGSADYLNCPLNQEQYYNLVDAINQAEKITPKDFDQIPFFEGCMPIETMAARGRDTLRFGPLKPVGLIPPGSFVHPYAVVQLRQDNSEGSAYNLVGFQTRMKYQEQIRVFRMIPGLEQAEFLKLGSIHKNLYINTPLKLETNLSSKKDPGLFFAGQITGVEGYFESTCIGLLVAYFIHSYLKQTPLYYPSRDSALGSLLHAITDPIRASHFQPINMNFSLFPEPQDPYFKSNKEIKRKYQIQKAEESFMSWFQMIH